MDKINCQRNAHLIPEKEGEKRKKETRNKWKEYKTIGKLVDFISN